MVPSPVEQSGESATAGATGGGGGSGDSQRSIPTPFLTKTYQLVEDPAVDELISWNEDGSSFVVWRPAEFARDLLPKYFKHNNFSSFVRQLNTYGFRKVVPDRWEFSNDCFRRGERNLLREIQRRKISSSTVAPVASARLISPTNSGDDQVVSANSSPGASAAGAVPSTSCTTVPELVEENERLRKENAHLSHELTRLRGLFNNMHALMTTYTVASSVNGGGGSSNNNNNDSSGGGASEGKQLELLRAAAGEERVAVEGAEEDVSPRLFGVSIGMKRVRNSSEEEQEDERWLNLQGNNNNDQVPTSVKTEKEAKREPSDGKSDLDHHQPDNDHDPTWLELGK